MHIGFDARYIRVDHHDGISRFSSRVGSALASLVEQNRVDRVTFIVSDERQLQHLPAGSVHVFANAPTSVREGSIAKRLNRHGFDVVYSPMQTIGSRGRMFRLVVTVHDLIYYTHRMPPRGFNIFVRALWRLYHLSWWPQRLLLNRADHVVAVSHTTANLIAQKKLTRGGVSVVYNATDLSSGSLDLARSTSSRENAVVYMGSFMPYKNVETLVRAANLLPETNFVFLSKIDRSDEERLSAGAVHSNLVFAHGVSDEEYTEYLLSARALVTATRDEGFGIPVLEAMALGTPVVCSDIPIFREIGGDAPLLVPTEDARAFADAISALSSETVFERQRQFGLSRAKEFSWDASASELLDVLNKVCGT